MTHPRKVIRTAVAAALTGQTAAEARVWPSREPPVDVETILIDQGPVILVYTRHDRTPKDGFSGGGVGFQRRECDLHIEITSVGGDDDIDDLAEVVEGIIDDLTIPGQPATEIRHVETQIESTQEFERPVAAALISYEACYWKAWRTDEEEDDFFPTRVSAAANGDAGEVVADCDDCDDCPPGAQP